MQLRTLRRSGMYAVYAVADEGRAVLAMTCGVDDPRWPAGLVARLLADAAGDADALLARLTPDAPPGWLMFAGAVVTADAIDVCHAGDLRIQLVVDGAVVAQTRDHTLGNAHPELAGSPHANVAARQLAPGKPPPDRATWPRPPGARLVIASYELHRHADAPIAWPGADFDWLSGAILELT